MCVKKLPLWMGRAGVGQPLTPSLRLSSLVGVKKRTKVIKNNVNPVWNEVCAFLHLPALLSAATASAGTSQGLVQEGRFLTGVVKEGRGWWSRVPTRSSWRLEPGRTGGGLACQANRGGCGLGRSKCLSLFPPALSAW